MMYTRHCEFLLLHTRAVVILLCLGLVLVIGCAYPYGRMNYKPLYIERLSLGMSKQEVEQAVGRPPSSVVGSRSTGGHTVQVWHYMKAYFNWSGGPDRVQYEYYLYFLDGKLVEWGEPGVWEHEADRILRVRLE